MNEAHRTDANRLRERELVRRPLGDREPMQRLRDSELTWARVAFLAPLFLFLPACGGGDGPDAPVPPPVVLAGHLHSAVKEPDVAFIFCSGHTGDGDKDYTYLNHPGNAGPYLLERIKTEFPDKDVLALAYGDGGGRGADGNPGSEGLIADLQHIAENWRSARVCALAHSHGAARLMHATRAVPNVLIHHAVSLDGNVFAFALSNHDDPEREFEFTPTRRLYRQATPVAALTDRAPANSRPAESYRLHDLELQDVVGWNIWSLLEVRLTPNLSIAQALDIHWALRPNGSTHRLHYRVSSDNHSTVKEEAGDSLRLLVWPWLEAALKRDLANGAFSLVQTRNLNELGPAIATADVDKDGRCDLVLSQADGNLAILRGRNSNSSPLTSPTLSQINMNATKILTLDADRDDKVDLLCLSSENSAGTSRALLAYGDGSASYTSIDSLAADIPSTRSLVDAAVIDLNLDERPDLLVLTEAGELWSILNDGGRSWADAEHIGTLPDSTELDALALLAEDMDGDRDCDLVVSVAGPGLTRNVLLVEGRREESGDDAGMHFDIAGAQAIYSTSSGLPASLACADQDLDGDLDILLQAGEAGDLVLLKNNGSGGFGQQFRSDGSWPEDPSQTLVMADLDGEKGLEAVVVLDEKLRVFDGSASIDARESQDLSVGAGAHVVALGDFNADDRMDIAVATWLAPSQVQVFLGQPTSGGGGLGEVIPKPVAEAKD